jgi:hypothetical protein
MALSTTTKFKNWHLKALRFSPNQLNIPNAQHPMVVLFMANRPLVSNAKKMKALKVQSQLYPANINSEGSSTDSKSDSKPSLSKGKYSCDGRTNCSQMTSCEEAEFFLRNCPNVEMDGNKDGVPCERQWCSSH